MAVKRKVSERVQKLTAVWLARPPEERTANHVLSFYGWLEENHPELLRRGHGDPYQHLQAELSPHIRK